LNFFGYVLVVASFIVHSAENSSWSKDNIHLERFGAEVNTEGAPFTVVAKKLGRSFKVQPGETISQKLEENGMLFAL